MARNFSFAVWEIKCTLNKLNHWKVPVKLWSIKKEKRIVLRILWFKFLQLRWPVCPGLSRTFLVLTLKVSWLRKPLGPSVKTEAPYIRRLVCPGKGEWLVILLPALPLINYGISSETFHLILSLLPHLQKIENDCSTLHRVIERNMHNNVNGILCK